MLLPAHFVIAVLGLSVAPQDSIPSAAVGVEDSVPPAALDTGGGAVLTNLAPTIDHVTGAVPLQAPESFTGASDTTTRARAVEYSDWYSTRLTIHRYASYATIPLFAAQYYVGRKLISQGSSASSSLRGVHGALAGTVAALFAVNTVTGLWNLWDSRKDPNGRTRRTVHSLMMVAADAGFVATGATAPDDDFNGGSSSAGGTHQAIAITSMGVALASYVMMLVWKD